MSLLRVRPWTVKKAIPFVARVHRRLPRRQGAMWALRVTDMGTMEDVGTALVGHAARLLGWDCLEVLRIAVLGNENKDAPALYPNACSMLYGACSRAGKAMGARNMVTYTHGDEVAASLKAAGWIHGGMTDGGEWSRQGRLSGVAIDPLPKHRWWAAWSERAKEAA